MSIRVQTPKSKIYHLQARGHAYWLTRCNRRWVQPVYYDGEGGMQPRVQMMPAVTDRQARELWLCKNCAHDWLNDNWEEVLKVKEGSLG